MLIMKKIILTQGLLYDDTFDLSFSWTPEIILALIKNDSILIIDSEEIDYGYSKLSKTIEGYTIYKNNDASNDYVLELDDKYYHFNYEDTENLLFGRTSLELINLLEKNSNLCLNEDKEIIYKVVEIPEDMDFEILRKETTRKTPDYKNNHQLYETFESEYIIEILKNPRIFE